MPEERTGEAFEDEEQLTVIGLQLQVGEKAPPFQLTLSHSPLKEVTPVLSSYFRGRVVLLSFVNALSTSVCRDQTRFLEDHTQALPLRESGAIIITVSMEPSIYLAGWRDGAALSLQQLLSAEHNPKLLEAYGVSIKEWPNMPQRAVFVIGGDGNLVLVRYIADQGSQEEADSAVMDAVEAVNKLLKA
ncbi:MAG: redoxin domain-containing protein [Candidatus Woykebacteria bacterium]